MTPCVVALQSTRSFTKMQYSMTQGGIFHGRDEIDRIAGVIKATHPDFEYQPLFPPEELGDAGRGSMGIWHSRQTTSLRGNRFYRRPERSHCFGLSLFRQSSLKQNAPPLPRRLDDECRQTF